MGKPTVHLGQRLAELMAARKVTHRVLAKDLHVSSGTPNHWIQTGNIPDHRVAAICQYFGLDESAFRYDTNLRPAADRRALLIETIRLVEEMTTQQDLTIPAGKKAELIATIYELFLQSGAVDRETVSRVLRLVA